MVHQSQGFQECMPEAGFSKHTSEAEFPNNIRVHHSDKFKNKGQIDVFFDIPNDSLCLDFSKAPKQPSQTGNQLFYTIVPDLTYIYTLLFSPIAKRR